MKKSNIMIRLEKKEEQQKVENLVRESFWNVYRPGCLEHYVLHQLRNDPAFVPELDFSQPRIKNDGLCFDISDKIVVDVNIAFLVIVHGIAFADLNFLNQAYQRGAV